MENVRDYLGPSPNVDPLPDGSYPEVNYFIIFFSLLNNIFAVIERRKIRPPEIL